MTFGSHTISEETYLAYTSADDSFRQLVRQVWCLLALANITAILCKLNKPIDGSNLTHQTALTHQEQ